MIERSSYYSEDIKNDCDDIPNYWEDENFILRDEIFVPGDGIFILTAINVFSAENFDLPKDEIQVNTGKKQVLVFEYFCK